MEIDYDRIEMCVGLRAINKEFTSAQHTSSVCVCVCVEKERID